MIALKPGVKLAGLTPQILLAVVAAEHVWWTHGETTLVITSANDGQHKKDSFHYKGQAVDLRIKTMPPELRLKAIEALARALGNEFDVLWEYRETDREHCHVEWDEGE